MEFNADKNLKNKEKEFFEQNAFTIQELEEANKRERTKKAAEVYFWSMMAIFFMVQPFMDSLQGLRAGEIALKRFDNVLFAMAFLVVPMVFSLIFNMFPMEAMRRGLASRFNFGSKKSDLSYQRAKAADASVLTGAVAEVEMCNLSAVELLSRYVTSSRALSKGLYNRAGVYLLVGVIVAFSGLVFFYMATSIPVGYQGLDLAVVMLPKFGILLFMELVAFFFLRQYRSAMDEFRYYEAIKRKREETLAIIQLLAWRSKDFDALELVKGGFFFSDGKVLNKDQSTEIIEARKLEKNELEVLEKIIEAVSRGKK
ncbi:hypothetical protein [Pseudomonas protegens]|uniref:hypothetical protein n=1 Tax=Pseudomonas protegens TaxID=380021 RepID=UPI00069F120D|nr:hypothetical protein [Pseudomonas protegens]